MSSLGPTPIQATFPIDNRGGLTRGDWPDAAFVMSLAPRPCAFPIHKPGRDSSGIGFRASIGSRELLNLNLGFNGSFLNIFSGAAEPHVLENDRVHV